MAEYTLSINGKKEKVSVSSDTPLLWVLRDHLKLKGTKYGCGAAYCGACTVHINGTATRSCVTPVSAVGTNEIKTIEGISEKGIHFVQKAWMEEDVPQCGYCQTGQIMTAIALLDNNPEPTDREIESAMAGNLCRCGTYDRIKKAIKRASESLK